MRMMKFAVTPGFQTGGTLFKPEQLAFLGSIIEGGPIRTIGGNHEKSNNFDYTYGCALNGMRKIRQFDGPFIA